MDKVDLRNSQFNPSHLTDLKQDPKKIQNRKNSKSRKSIFSEFLSGAADIGPVRDSALSEEVLAELMDAVHRAGSDLLDRPFHYEILKYKRAVRDFVHYVVENSYGIEKKQTRLRELRKLKPHVQINIIDRKLEDLATAILAGQINQLKLASKLTEIRGLLVDLTIAGVIKERDD